METICLGALNVSLVSFAVDLAIEFTRREISFLEVKISDTKELHVFWVIEVHV